MQSLNFFHTVATNSSWKFGYRQRNFAFEICSIKHHTSSVYSYLMKNVPSWVYLTVCTKKSTAPLVPVFAPLINWVMVHVANSVFHPLRGNCAAALIGSACHNRQSWASFPLRNNSLSFHIQSPSCPIILLVQWERVGREKSIKHEGSRFMGLLILACFFYLVSL